MIALGDFHNTRGDLEVGTAFRGRELFEALGVESAGDDDGPLFLELLHALESIAEHVFFADDGGLIERHRQQNQFF